MYIEKRRNRYSYIGTHFPKQSLRSLHLALMYIYLIRLRVQGSCRCRGLDPCKNAGTTCNHRLQAEIGKRGGACPPLVTAPKNNNTIFARQQPASANTTRAASLPVPQNKYNFWRDDLAKLLRLRFTTFTTTNYF